MQCLKKKKFLGDAVVTGPKVTLGEPLLEKWHFHIHLSELG